MRPRVTIGIIGCGQICEAHLKEIALIADARVGGVCDLVGLLAEDAAYRFSIPQFYCDYIQMLNEVHPDVVHITTPPHTHLEIALNAIELGCHVYIEKPFGINCEEARVIVEAAKRNHVIACAGFSQLFDLVAMRAKGLIEKGDLGDVVHMESYYGNSLEGDFSRIFLNDKDHWIHRMPGKLLQNIISHALYHIVPWFGNDLQRIVCFSQDRSGNGLFQDELRVLMQSGKVTGYMTFTSAVKPVTQFLRFYGTKGILEMDLANHMLSMTEASTLPGPVARVRHGLVSGKRMIGEGLRHAKNMWSGEDRFFAGMGNLFRALYRNVREGRLVPPVPYENVLNVAAVMDIISRQCQEIEKAHRQVV